ncbi:MAG: four helix bundle protein [Patescibacteria group bacterium]
MNNINGEINTPGNYKELIVWQRSMELVVAVYELTKGYPKDERYGLTAHTRKTAISVPSNIAEGRRRSTKKDYRQFLIRAYVSGAELETQLEIAKRLLFVDKLNFFHVDKLLEEVMKMLNKMVEPIFSEITRC